MRLTCPGNLAHTVVKTGLMILLMFTSIAVHAEYTRGDMNFSLFIENEEVGFRYSNNLTLDTRLTRIKVTWDQSLSSWLRGGLNLAYLDVSQPANPVEAGLKTVGYGLGFNLRAIAIEQRLLRLSVFFNYDYQSTRGSSDNQNTDLNWQEIEGGLDFTVLPQAPAAILLGVSSTAVYGEQNDSGTINRVTSFREAENLGYYAGVHVRTDASGGIGLKGYGGRSRGFYLYFSRRF